MNALQLLQALCYEMNIPAVSSSTATDPATAQLRNLLYSTGRDLRQEKCWVQLKRTHTVTGDGGDEYPLPDDFYCSIIDTFWDKTNRWKMKGPLTDSKWNEVLYGYVVVTTQKFYRIFGRTDDKIQVNPAPGVGDELTFDYMSKNWILDPSPSDVWQETITGDDNEFAFDDDILILGIKSRWYQAKGLEWEPYYSEYKNKIAQTQARYQGNRKVVMYPWMDMANAYGVNVPEGNYSF